MLNTTIINHVTDDGVREEKVIYELEEKKISKYFLIGRATGINMNHCVMLGAKHKDNFWHRVYGYVIIKDDKIAKILTESMRKIKPETAPYISIQFFERLADHQCMFVPRHLEIPDRPELVNFPFNILFQTNCIDDKNMETQATALYEPDLSTFIQEGEEQKMKYYNTLNSEKRFYVEIIYNTNKQSYFGHKYCGDKIIGSACGPKWQMFFVHLTLLGVGTDENC